MEVGVRPTNGISHVKGSVSEPLWDYTIPELLKKTAERFGSNDAAIFPQQNIRWSYRDFLREVDALAGGLHKLGFQKGDRIGVWSPNRYEWLLAQFATARIGVILVNINPAYRPYELEYVLGKVGVRGLITARQFKSSDYTGMLQGIAPEIADSDPFKLQLEKLPLLQNIVCMGEDIPSGMLSFNEVHESGRDVASSVLDGISYALDCNDPINIQFTSGTTGHPKGATLTHRNIINNAKFVTAAMKFTDADRLCIPVPFYHCFGMVMGTLGCVTKGATMVVPREGFDAEATLQAVSDEKCTALFGVPTMFLAEFDHPKFGKFDTSHLRTGIMAGAPCPIEIMKRVEYDMGLTGITIAYGMTETSPVSFQSAVDDPVERRVASVGRIHPHVEVKIVDENRTPVPVGEQGELLTRGYSVMLGYWGEEEKTADCIDADGWMHTGDIARIDEEGYCNITGRVKDMIVRGGENIYPREIEEFLYTHPAISLVQVFGIPDAKFGEIACCWITLKEGEVASEDDVRTFCKENIAHYKVPALFRFVDDIPMTVTGKPQKFIMRERMVDELNLHEIETA